MSAASHLLQMRGLKLVCRLHPLILSVSHLLQMRGLKRLFELGYRQNRWSHLLQMRGLKRERCQCWIMETFVASFTDAWIETISNAKILRVVCRIFYRCVD